MRAVRDPATGQIDITDAGQPVLCYHCEVQYQQQWDRYQER
jgi:hypothetical protein